jgi:hypothetical protein
MGNAKWAGVRLRDVLARAGIKPGAKTVRFNGLDQPVTPDGPDFMKSLALEHAGDGDVMIAYAMNGEPLPLLNGFPLRLVVPGWFSTYWLKMLSDIEVLAGPDDNFWMAEAYKIPDTPGANMRPGQAGVKMVPISRMLPRSFITNVKPHERLRAGAAVPLRGIAFGGDCGVESAEVSTDGGRSWTAARLGRDEGRYSFRRWDLQLKLDPGATHTLMVRCTNSNNEVQPMTPNWNPGGYMRNVVEALSVTTV